MIEKLPSGQAFKDAGSEIEEFRALNARARKAQAARETEQRTRDERLQADLRTQMYARNPHLKDAA